MVNVKRPIIIVGVLIFCLGLTAALHFKGLKGPFQFDDERDIVERAEVREGPWAAMRSSPYRAITYLTYALDWKSGDGAPMPFHRTNLAIHLATVVLVYLLLLSFIPEDRGVLRTGGAACGSLFFGLNPLAASNVTYISGRAGLLAALFSLAAIWFYRRRPFRGWQAPAMAFFIMALFSKEDSASLPLLLLPLGMIGEHREAHSHLGRWRPWIAVAPFFILAAIYGVFRVFGHTVLLGEKGGLPWQAHLLLGPYVWMRLLIMVFWPVGLSVDHYVSPISGFFDPRLILPILGVMVFVISEVRLWRRKRIAALWLIWFAVALLPASVVPLADPLAENRAYFALAGMSIGVGFIIGGSAQELQKAIALWACFAIMLISFIFLTYQQEFIWASQLRLWEDAARRAPDGERSWSNLGVIWVRNRNFRGADFAARRALGLDQNDAVAWNTLGLVYKEKKDFEKALRSYETAIKIDPGLRKVRANRGHVLLVMGRLKDAETTYQEALTLDPLDTDAHYGLGFLYYITGQLSRAREEMQRTLELDPNDEMAKEILSKLPPASPGTR